MKRSQYCKFIFDQGVVCILILAVYSSSQKNTAHTDINFPCTIAAASYYY